MTSATERNERIGKLFRVARQKFDPAAPPGDRKLLEHLIYACLLEDSSAESADEVFARLQLDYFDWNEVRVTTTVELAELMKSMPDPAATANRLRRALHGMFEAHYSFDLEFLRKENLGKAIETVSKYRGMTPFSIAYVTQHALGGHAIPLDQTMMNLMYSIGVVDPAELSSMKVTGLERVIPKNQGVEFASVVHQLAVAWRESPFSNDLRALLKKINPDAEQFFPKRGGKPKAPETPAATAVAEPVDPKKKTAAKPEAPKKAAAKPAPAETRKTAPATPPRKNAPPKPPAKKAKPVAAKPAGKPPAGKTPAKASPAKKTDSRKLAKKKPR